MSNVEGFIPIEGIFFAAFHPKEGSKILCQVPEDVVFNNSLNQILSKDTRKESKASVDSSEDGKLLGSQFLNPKRPASSGIPNDSSIDYNDIRNIVIPKPEFCNKLLSTKAGEYKVIGYPVNIKESYYARNSFTFNFCFIFKYNGDSTCYEPVVRRIGKMFKVLEEQSQILSKSSNDLEYFDVNNKDIKEYILQRDLNSKYYDILNTFRQGDTDINNLKYNLAKLKINDNNKNGEFSIENLIQQIYQDLNDYSECSIKINAGNSIDIKLFPNLRLPDVDIFPCDVPISTIDLQSIVDFYWDPNILRMIPFINGVNNIAKIARLTNSDYEYTCLCIRHLMIYKCIILLDTFSFQNIYATTSKISLFLDHSKILAEECKNYCFSGKSTNPISDLPFRFMEKRNNSFFNDNFDEGSINGSIKENGRFRYSPNPVDIRNALNGGTNTSSQNKQPNTLAYKRKNTDTSLEPNSKSFNNKQTVPYSYESGNFKMTNSSGGEVVESYNKSGSTNGINFDPKRAWSTIEIFQMYCSFNQGRTVEHWYQTQENLLRGVDIDIRRFITFGLLQGLLYRIHFYPMLGEYNSKWLSKCNVFYLEKNDEVLEKLSQLINTRNTKAIQEHVDKIYEDEIFMKQFNETHYLNSLTFEEINKKNYRLCEFNTSIFPKPGTNRDRTKTVKHSYGGNGSIIAESIHTDQATSTNYSTNQEIQDDSKGYQYNPNKISLQRFRDSSYIKLIQGRSKKGEKYFYSLTSVLTLKKNYLDKMKHFDLICTEFGMNKKEVQKVMENFWKFHVVER